MKALTLRHPWPFAICHWGKRIENRGWRPRTELKIGQRFAIHGGRPPSDPSYRRYVDETVQTLLDRFGFPAMVDEETTFRELLHMSVQPGISCTAVLEAVVTESDDPWFEGPLGWVLGSVHVLDSPIPCKGAQGLWDVPADVLKKIKP